MPKESYENDFTRRILAVVVAQQAAISRRRWPLADI
jgi:hypothetical protein